MDDLIDLLRVVRTLSWRSRFDALRVFGITLKSARDLYFQPTDDSPIWRFKLDLSTANRPQLRRFGSCDNPKLGQLDDLGRQKFRGK